MSARVANPSARSIFGIPDPHAGIETFNVGVGSAHVGNVWDTRSSDGRFAASPAKALNYGQAPTSHGHISLKSVEFIQYSYSTPNVDDSDMLIMSEMPAFVVREMDKQGDSTIVLSLAKVNELAQEQWNDFELMSNVGGGNVHLDDSMVEFRASLQYYGEAGLEHYASEVSDPVKGALFAQSGYATRVPENAPRGVLSLSEFHHRATLEGFCYLTRYGFLQRLNFRGIVLNSNHAESNQDLDTSPSGEHYTQVNIGVGKRIRTANIFGPADKIVTGTRLWLILKRKRTGMTAPGKSAYGAFQIVPGGDKMLDYPLAHQMSYLDESGALRPGFHWKVGIVMEPNPRSAQPAAIQMACNLGNMHNERAAYEAHAGLPSMYVSVGFK